MQCSRRWSTQPWRSINTTRSWPIRFALIWPRRSESGLKSYRLIGTYDIQLIVQQWKSCVHFQVQVHLHSDGGWEISARTAFDSEVPMGCWPRRIHQLRLRYSTILLFSQRVCRVFGLGGMKQRGERRTRTTDLTSGSPLIPTIELLRFLNIRRNTSIADKQRELKHMETSHPRCPSPSPWYLPTTL